MTVQDDPEVPRSVHSCDGRREYRNFVHVDFLHLLSGTQPDDVRRIQTIVMNSCHCSEVEGLSTIDDYKVNLKDSSAFANSPISSIYVEEIQIS